MSDYAKGLINVVLDVDIAVIQYPTAGGASQVVVDNLNAIEFYNAGNSTVFINNRPVLAGQTYGMAGNLGERIKTPFVMTWPPGATGADKNVFVTVKTYT